MQASSTTAAAAPTVASRPGLSDAGADAAMKRSPLVPTQSEGATTKADPVPNLRDDKGKPLPQTEELPSFDSPTFKRRIELLFESIVKDDPKLAAPAFFPLVAYEQVKEISQPGRDYKVRLMPAFAKNIHEYHQQLGKAPSQAKLLGVSPSTLAARWMRPGTEGNRLSYHRLLRSRLKVADGDGADLVFEITSMISWRGEWYVVHLNGFK